MHSKPGRFYVLILFHHVIELRPSRLASVYIKDFEPAVSKLFCTTHLSFWSLCEHMFRVAWISVSFDFDEEEVFIRLIFSKKEYSIRIDTAISLSILQIHLKENTLYF